LHWPDRGVPIDETLEALTRLIEEGKIDTGSHATVHYRVENSENIATTVKGSAAKKAT